MKPDETLYDWYMRVNKTFQTAFLSLVNQYEFQSGDSLFVDSRGSCHFNPCMYMMLAEFLRFDEGRLHSVMILNCSGTFDKNFLSMCLSKESEDLKNSIASRVVQVKVNTIRKLREFTQELSNFTEKPSDPSPFHNLTSIFVFGLDTFFNPFEREGFRPLALESLSSCLRALRHWSSATSSFLCVQSSSFSSKAPKSQICSSLERFRDTSTASLSTSLIAPPTDVASGMQGTVYRIHLKTKKGENGEGRLAIFMPHSQDDVNFVLENLECAPQQPLALMGGPMHPLAPEGERMFALMDAEEQVSA
eukprot:GDKJ01036731.1.p1 GENE.GDKJ01036731.1~~GDKJ01036731.1.p1  ORF type:complete len:305 (-),score=50.04 GDKJ01036731.1:20-934(-)